MGMNQMNVIMHCVLRAPSVLRVPLACALLGACSLALSQAGDVQPGFENAGRPHAEFLLGDLRAYAGKKFWVRRPLPGQTPIALFCDHPEPPPGKDCPRERFGVERSEAFTIENVAIAKPDPQLSWFSIRFDSNKKSAFLSLQDFTQHPYNEGRVSTALFGIDYALANSGWIFDDFPDKVLNNRRAQLERERDAPKLEEERLARERVMRVKLLYVGMTAQEVLNSTWGRPNAISHTTIGRRHLEQWDYGGGNYLYFENDRLQRYQVNSR